jgi:hypothetical protein
MAREPNGRFIPGTGAGGRKVGSRNRLQGNFCDALAKDFAEHGEGVIRIVRLEKPVEYIKIVASILPKEFFVSDNAIDEMGEDELLQVLEEIRKTRAAAATAH